MPLTGETAGTEAPLFGDEAPTDGRFIGLRAELSQTWQRAGRIVLERQLSGLVTSLPIEEGAESDPVHFRSEAQVNGRGAVDIIAFPGTHVVPNHARNGQTEPLTITSTFRLLDDG